jgi:hypothetical protein
MHPTDRRRPAMGLAASALLVMLPGAAGASGQHVFGDYRIGVTADTTAVLSPTEYQITVENAELLLTRLTAPYQGTLSNSFVADLDRDGRFEVVVTYSHGAGRATELDVYTWTGELLQPLAVAALAPAQQQGYRGEDEYAVKDGTLVRMFQVYEQVDGAWQPTATRRQLRYSFATASWAE